MAQTGGVTRLSRAVTRSSFRHAPLEAAANPADVLVDPLSCVSGFDQGRATLHQVSGAELGDRRFRVQSGDRPEGAAVAANFRSRPAGLLIAGLHMPAKELQDEAPHGGLWYGAGRSDFARGQVVGQPGPVRRKRLRGVVTAGKGHLPAGDVDPAALPKAVKPVSGDFVAWTCHLRLLLLGRLWDMYPQTAG